MIHTENLQELHKKLDSHGHLYPSYGKYSVAEIVPTIMKWFGLETHRHVFPPEISGRRIPENKKLLLFMIDGFGFDHLARYYREMEFFSRMAERAEVWPITSTFPSTTPAALTTIHTGLTPQEHGLPEWTLYLEELDKIIESLPFRQSSEEQDSLLKVGGRPEMLYEGDTIYERLRLANIRSYCFMPEEYSHSAYNRMVKRGGIAVKYSDGEDLFQKLRDYSESEPGPAYFFIYWPKIDTVEHIFGPNSKEHIHELQKFSDLVMNEFLNKLDINLSGNMQIALTADHGQANIKNEQIIYLNQYPLLEENYMLSKQGNRILPSGAPHDVFLFIKPEKRDEVVTFLRVELRGKAEVITSEEGFKRGLFGLNDPSVKFQRRVGNVLILTEPGYHVWYKYDPNYFWGQLGIHGGLSREEMTVPFALTTLKELKE